MIYLLWLVGSLLGASAAQAAFIPTYDIVSFVPDIPESSALVRIAIIRRVRLTKGLPFAICNAKTAPAAQVTVTINKIRAGVATAIGTLTWAGGSNNCSVTFGSTVDLAIGDLVEEAYPAIPDVTMANIAITLPGIRMQ